MHEQLLTTAARLSDEALLARLKSLAVRERDATVEIVAHLAELDARRIHLAQGPGSVYKYCRDVLGYSEDAAWNRAATAAAVRRYPIILGWLADGSLNVTTVRILKSVLTPENHVAVLTEARRRSKKEVELIEARLNPRADVPSTIRKVVVPRASHPNATLLEVDAARGVAGGGIEAPIDMAVVPGAPPRPLPAAPAPATPAPATPPPVGGPAAVSAATRVVIAPLTPERYRLQFTISKETHDTLRHLQDLLCREIPDGDPAVIFDRALKLLAADVEKKKLAATTKPRPPRDRHPSPACEQGVSRDIPAHVRRAVWKRDGGQCAFAGKAGRCTERRFLEWHHVLPFAHEGRATVENIALRCRAHNVYESDLVFGRCVSSGERDADPVPRKVSIYRENAPFRNGGGGSGSATGDEPAGQLTMRTPMR